MTMSRGSICRGIISLFIIEEVPWDFNQSARTFILPVPGRRRPWALRGDPKKNRGREIPVAIGLVLLHRHGGVHHVAHFFFHTYFLIFA